MTCIKYLGVLIDSTLNWKEHILIMSKKITKSIGIICKLRHFVNTQTLVQLYYAVVYPFLTYGCMIWGSTYCSNKPIEILQKRTIRIISFAKFDEHSTPLRKTKNYQVARHNLAPHCMLYVSVLQL